MLRLQTCTAAERGAAGNPISPLKMCHLWWRRFASARVLLAVFLVVRNRTAIDNDRFHRRAFGSNVIFRTVHRCELPREPARRPTVFRQHSVQSP